MDWISVISLLLAASTGAFIILFLAIMWVRRG
jgi:hypothetical protein